MSQKAKFNFVILAAGRSERMFEDKALLDYHGNPWINVQLQNIQKCPSVDQVYVITNPINKSPISAVLPKGIHILENGKVDSDTFSSILVGLEGAKNSDGIFVSPVDVPLDSQIIQAIALAAREDLKAVLPEQGGKKGHPVLLMRGAVLELLQKNIACERLDFYLRDLTGSEVLSLPVANGKILLNLNTPKAWNDFIN